MKNRKIFVVLAIALHFFFGSIAYSCPAVGSDEFELDYHLNGSNTWSDWVTSCLTSSSQFLSKAEVAQRIIDYVQNLTYISEDLDPGIPWEYRGMCDWWQTPDETLLKGGGDCEDLAMLCYAMLNRAGISAVIILMPGHMAVGVDIPAYGGYLEYWGNQYFFVECTSPVPVGEGGDGYASYEVIQP